MKSNKAEEFLTGLQETKGITYTILVQFGFMLRMELKSQEETNYTLYKVNRDDASRAMAKLTNILFPGEKRSQEVTEDAMRYEKLLGQDLDADVMLGDGDA